MPLSRRRFLSLVALAGAGAACSSGDKGDFIDPGPGGTFDDVFAGRAQTLALTIPPYEILKGTDQHASAVILTNPGNQPVPGATGRVWFAKGRTTEAIGPFDLRPLEDGFNARGIYGFTINLPEDGIWLGLVEAQRAEDGQVEVGVTANVAIGEQQGNEMPRPGERAISTPTPTTKNPRGIDPICTLLPEPCSMHGISLDAALRGENPTVLLIGTPRFCTSQFCGPEVEILDGIARETPGVNFIHVEVLKDDEQDTVNAFQGRPPEGYRGSPLAPAAIEWKLYEEPVLYFIDARGTTQSRLLGAVDGVAMRVALDALTA